MAISTYKTFLMKGSGSGTLTWAKLIDIKTSPDIMSAPEKIDVTTLSDSCKVYIPGIKDNGDMECSALYTAEDFQTLSSLENQELDLAIWYGGTVSGSTVTPTGSEGKFTFKGYVSVSVKGGSVNEAVEMTITLTPSTVPVFSVAA